MPFPKRSVVLLFGCLLWIMGCSTTLPDVSTLEQSHISSGIPAIVSSRGPLSHRETKRTFEELQFEVSCFGFDKKNNKRIKGKGGTQL